MELRKSKRSSLSILMYIVAAIVLIAGIASLIIGFLLFRSNVAQYVAQGYPEDIVRKQLTQSTLLPLVFQSLSYIGIAFGLYGIGALSNKLSSCLSMMANCTAPVEAAPISIEENTEVVDETGIPEGNESTVVEAEDSEENENTNVESENSEINE